MIINMNIRAQYLGDVTEHLWVRGNIIIFPKGTSCVQIQLIPLRRKFNYLFNYHIGKDVS